MVVWRWYWVCWLVARPVFHVVANVVWRVELCSTLSGTATDVAWLVWQDWTTLVAQIVVSSIPVYQYVVHTIWVPLPGFLVWIVWYVCLDQVVNCDVLRTEFQVEVQVEVQVDTRLVPTVTRTVVERLVDTLASACVPQAVLVTQTVEVCLPPL